MGTESITRGVLIVASEEIGSHAAKHIGEKPGLRSKSVTGARAALGAISSFAPHILVFEAGMVPVPAMQAVKNMAELAASRQVPLIMVCGPLDETAEKLRETLGIVEVLEGAYSTSALVEAIQALVDKWEQARQESQVRKQKQIQIQQRLRSASNKYMAMSEEAAKQKLEMSKHEQQAAQDLQDFASDDAAPPSEPDPDKPSVEPTWDGS